jgi:DNA gyrase subunit A
LRLQFFGFLSTIAIDLKRNIEPETVKRQLYKYTSLESSFSFNTLAIVDRKPKNCNLKDFLESFLKFREDVVVKKTKFELKKAEDRAHILIGLSVSVENLDKIIKIIRSSKTPDDAKQSILKTKWKINRTQKLISLVEDKKLDKKSFKLQFFGFPSTIARVLKPKELSI